MLKTLIFFARFFLFWLLFFLLERIIFLGANLHHLATRPLTEILAAGYHGLQLDLSMTAYIAVVPLLVFIVVLLFNGQKTLRLTWLKVYHKILIVLFSIIAVANLNIYREWGSKINAKALGFAIHTPNEALASSASSPILLNICILALLLISGLWLNKKIIKDTITITSALLPFKLLFAVLLLGFNFLLIRGGWGVATNNPSVAYYSDMQLLNHAAVNTEWNLISSMISARRVSKNPNVYYDAGFSSRVVKDLYAVEKDSTTHFLKTNRPNVIIIIMESFTADLTKTLGNENGITPHFDSLIRKGVFFNKIYATGNRTDKGIIGTLAGFPSLAAESINKWPEKMEKVPALPQVFFKHGYSTSFFYGGQSEFDNYKAFIKSHDYQLLVDRSKFNGKDMNSKWGAYDGVVFNRQLQDLNKEKQPFFSTQMTLTNHEPFEVPGSYKFGNKDNVQKFKSTAFYTDSCLNDFLNKAKKQAWYKNTLFIFVADHGHILPKGREEVYIPQRYHIPLLFFGEVIREAYRGKQMEITGSQVDIASTLLHQLDMGAESFTWSKNLMNPYTKPFAYFSWDNGMGFIDNKQCITFDNVGKMILYNDKPEDTQHTQSLTRNGKAYLQTVYQQFIDL